VLIGALTEPLASHRTFDETLGVEVGTYEQLIQLRQRVRAVAPEATWAGTIAWQSCKGDQCNMPEEWNFRLTIAPNATIHDSQTTTHETIDTTIVGNDTPIVDKTSTTDLWRLILMAIGWGLLALLTPCVFPMIPMTVSFFLKGSESVATGRFKAMMYGVFIVLLYTLPIAVIILLTRLLGGDTVTADIFNWIATHWLPNLLFFGIFMFFAASFFGAFEITLPSSIVNKSDRRADRGGLLGVFFMALTLVLVSFSCTGPIVGSALIGATSGAFWAPILTMLLFSATFALPFTLFALFPSLLKNLPKSGGWLNSVKVCLGFIEVALGFKFLSVADQTYHWHLLDREVYLAIWIVCFTLLGFYLLGKLRFAHDSEVKSLSVGRLFLALVDFTFVVYLIPGMWGAPLRALSGYLPPLHTQDFVLAAQSQTTSAPSTTSQVKYGNLLTSPPGVEGFFDLQEAIAEAHRTNKPLFIDVTGHGCVNCREMEQRVFTNERVQAMLRNFVVVSLYTDDKSPVAPADYLTTDSGTQLRELGRINAYLARTRYGINAQPGYVVADEAGDAIVQPWSYELDVDKFLAHLREGLVAYHNKASQQ
jgi:thiol:disulfide interchange protein DsbD